MTAQIYDGEDDDDVNGVITTHYFLKLKSETHARLSSSFVVLPITRMQQCAQTKDPKMLDNATLKYLVHLLPFGQIDLSLPFLQFFSAHENRD